MANLTPTARFAFCLLAFVMAIWVSSGSGNSDADALIALKRNLSDPNHVLDSWDPNLVNPCTWFHITCNDDNRVTRVDLGLQNLGGQLVPQLGNLDALQYLELYKNNIHGSIPAELGNLKNLLSMDLYNNHLSGTIPPSFGNLNSLLFLRLNDNPLTGTVPPQVSRLPNLRILNITNTQIHGSNSFARIWLNNSLQIEGLGVGGN